MIQIFFIIKANWSVIKQSVLSHLTSATVAAGAVAVVAPAATAPILAAAAAAPIVASTVISSDDNIFQRECRNSRRRYSRNDESEDDEREERERMWKKMNDLEKTNKLVLQRLRASTPTPSTRKRRN